MAQVETEDRHVDPVAHSLKALDLDKANPSVQTLKSPTLQASKSMDPSSNRSPHHFFGHGSKESPSHPKDDAHHVPRFLPVFRSKSTLGGTQDHKVKSTGHHEHHHGTRFKDVFGREDAGTLSTQKSDDLFGYRDAEDYESSKKEKDLFGIEDVDFETGKKGHDLFGNDDLENAEVFGTEDADTENNHETRQVFGKEEEDGSSDEK